MSGKLIENVYIDIRLLLNINYWPAVFMIIYIRGFQNSCSLDEIWGVALT